MSRSPFLTEREHQEVADARRDNNPELYPGTRTAILLGVIERACSRVAELEAERSAVRVDVTTAFAAVQAVNEQLQRARVRAAADARYACEVVRLETARAALDAAINDSLRIGALP